MKLAVMQPYFAPYLGYFQLIHAVDAFVVYDDVNFIKGGWINRNNILVQGRPQRITLPLRDASPNQKINQVQVIGNHRKILKTIHQAYSKAPCFNEFFPIIEEILLYPEINLSRFLYHSLKVFTAYLDIHPIWHLSSEIPKNNSLRGETKILAICKQLNVSQYINPLGGKNLYQKENFLREGLNLSFIQPKITLYKQFSSTQFIPNLSIIDTLMFVKKNYLGELLQAYELV